MDAKSSRKREHASTDISAEHRVGMAAGRIGKGTCQCEDCRANQNVMRRMSTGHEQRGSTRGAPPARFRVVVVAPRFLEHFPVLRRPRQPLSR
eukprot:472984-Rhodomonas_salina.1